MALADISLLPILITIILALKLLIANYHHPMRETDQYKALSLLLFLHLCAILGSIDDTPIIDGWLGSLWSLRYVLTFFVAWFMEGAWIIVGLRYKEDIIFPAFAFVLTEICIWVWLVFRTDQNRGVEVHVMEKRDVRDALARLGWVFLAGLGCLAVACVLDRVLWWRGEGSASRGRRHDYGTMDTTCNVVEAGVRSGGEELGRPKSSEAETQDVCACV